MWGNGDVDSVEHEESDGFPHLDALVEEDEDEVENANGVEDDVAEEGALVDFAVGEDGNASGNDRGNEETRAHIRAHADLRESRQNGDDQREDVGGSVSEG